MAIGAKQVALARLGLNGAPDAVGQSPRVELKQLGSWVTVMEFHRGQIS
jgi:hypothetical protein